jgi:hypothetical protein
MRKTSIGQSKAERSLQLPSARAVRRAPFDFREIRHSSTPDNLSSDLKDDEGVGPTQEEVVAVEGEFCGLRSDLYSRRGSTSRRGKRFDSPLATVLVSPNPPGNSQGEEVFPHRGAEGGNAGGEIGGTTGTLEIAVANIAPSVVHRRKGDSRKAERLPHETDSDTRSEEIPSTGEAAFSRESEKAHSGHGIKR